MTATCKTCRNYEASNNETRDGKLRHGDCIIMCKAAYQKDPEIGFAMPFCHLKLCEAAHLEVDEDFGCIRHQLKEDNNV